jgi:hypothetical protein
MPQLEAHVLPLVGYAIFLLLLQVFLIIVLRQHR